MTDDQRGISMRRTQWRSGALTFLPLPDQLRNRAREGRLEVDQLHPRRDHDDPDHAVVERTDLGLPLNPLLGRHLVGAVHLEVLVRDALDDVQLGPTADQQDLWRVHLGVDRQGDRRVVAQGRELGGVLGRAHDDLRAVPDEPDRDRPGCAVLGHVGQAGQVAGQELLADRTVQDLGDLARLHGQTSLPTVVHQYRPSLGLRQWVRWNRAGTSRDDRRALTPCGHLEVSCLPCHRRSWNPSGSRSPRCCPPARSPTRWAATARASPTGSCSTSSSSCWCSAAATAASPTTPARRSPCAADGMSGSPPAWPSGSARRCWPPTTECTAWSWSSWRWTGAPPRHPAAARWPGPAPWIDASRASSARSPSRRAASRWRRCQPQPTSATTGCWPPPWTPSGCSARYPPGRSCTWMLAMTTSRAGRSWPNGRWWVRSPRGASQHRSRRVAGGWSSAPMPGATSTASCAGAPSGAGWSSSSGWRWPTPPSSVAAWSAAPGLATAWQGRPRRRP